MFSEWKSKVIVVCDEDIEEYNNNNPVNNTTDYIPRQQSEIIFIKRNERDSSEI